MAKQEKNDLELFNESLIKIANADRVGIRRKILAVKKYIQTIGTKTNQK